MTRFLYDWRKSLINEEKHGIGFEEAKRLWDDPFRATMFLNHKGERRYLLIARYGGTLWAAVCTDRGRAVRIISVRRATRREVRIYDRRGASYGRGN